jgi:hypothetical protein
MATRNARAAAAPSNPPAGARSPWDWMGDWNRQQVAVASEGASTLFRGFEAMRRVQEQAAHAAAERHAAVAEKLRQPAAPADVALAQVELLRDDIACAARYWQDLAAAMLEMNSQLLNCAAQLVDTEDVMAATSARFLHS